MIVWLNDALADIAEARIDPAERGFLLGDGLFETIAMRNGESVRLESHLARLKLGCELLRLPYPSIDLAAAIGSVCAANNLADAAVRLTLTRGIAPRGLLPPAKPQTTLLIGAASWPGEPTPARCVIANVTRRNEYSPLAGIKSISNLDNVLARQEAAARGGNEAILLNTRSRVAESCSANLFIVKNKRLVTPPIEEGALPGVMRAAVLGACDGVQSPLTVEDLFAADGIFLTNSLGIRRVASLDGKVIGNAARVFMEELRLKLAA